MTQLVSFEVLTGIVAVTLLVMVKSSGTRLKRAVASFGGPRSSQSMTDDIRGALARQYMRQQAIAFGLVVAAIVLGLLFASGLLYRVVFARTLRLEDVGRAAALAGDLFLGRYASRSYRDASERAEKLIVTSPPT